MLDIQGKISCNPLRLEYEDDACRATRMVHMVEQHRAWFLMDDTPDFGPPSLPDLTVDWRGLPHMKYVIWETLWALLKTYVRKNRFANYDRVKLNSDQVRKICAFMAMIESDAIDVRHDTNKINRELGFFLDMSLHKLGYKYTLDEHEQLKIRLKKLN